MSARPSVSWSAAASVGRHAVSVGVVLLLIPLLIRSVGASHFALWSLSFSVLGAVGLLDAGLATSVVKYVAECTGEDASERRNRVLSSVAVVYLALAVIAAVGIAVLGARYTSVFHIPPGDAHTAIALLWILGCRVVILSLPLSVLRGALVGVHQIPAVSAVQVTSTLMYGAVSYVALRLGAGIVTVAWVNLAAMLLENAGYAMLAFRRVHGLRLSFSLVDTKLLREMSGFGVSQLVVNVAALIMLRTDPLIIKLYLPLAAVAIYAIAMKVAENVHLLMKQAVNATAPYVAQLHAKGDRGAIGVLFIETSRLAFAPSVACVVGALVFGRAAIAAWVGPDYVAAAPVLVVLLAAMALAIPQVAASTALAMGGHQRRSAQAALIGSVVNVVASLLLVRRFGIMGVAAGTLVSTAIVDGYVVPRLACRAYGVRYRTFLLRVLRPSVLPALAQYACSIVFARMLPPHGLAAVALSAGAGFAIFAVVFVMVSLSSAERARLVHALRHRGRRDAAAPDAPAKHADLAESAA